MYVFLAGVYMSPQDCISHGIRGGDGRTVSHGDSPIVQFIGCLEAVLQQWGGAGMGGAWVWGGGSPREWEG